MYQIEIKLNGSVIAVVTWQPMGDHNTMITGAWGGTSMYCKSLGDALQAAQRRIGGFE